MQTTEINSDRNQSIQVSGDGKNVVTYDSYDGKFYKISPDGTQVAMSDQTFFGANNVTWAPSSDKAVITFADGTNIVYNFDTKKQVTLPKHWQEFQFSPSGNQLAFKSLGPTDNQFLAIANSDGSGARTVEDMGRQADMFNVAWSPSNQVVGTFREGVDNTRQKLYFIGQNNENFKAAEIDGRGLETTWSKGGDRMLYSTYTPDSGYKPTLYIVDALGDSIGNNRRSLQLNTWASKCSFADNTTVYCAVPDSLPDGAGLLPNATDKGPDSLYKVDIQKGTTQKIATPASAHAIETITVSPDQTSLYFNDKDTGALFSVKLK